MALKVWKWIVDMISKVGHFLMSLIGKGDSTYQRLVKLIKKHKDSKTTNLDGQEFSESTQKSICKKFKILAKDKNVDSSYIKTELDEIKTILENADNGKTAILENGLFAKKSSSELGGMYDAIVNGIDDNGKIKSGEEANFKNAVDAVIKLLPIDSSAAPYKTLSDWTAVANSGSDKGLDIADGISDEITDAPGGKYVVVGRDFSNVYVVAYYISEDGEDAISDYVKSKAKTDTDFDPKKFLSAANKVVKGFKVRDVVITVEDSEYDDNYKNINPITFNEVEDIKDAMKDTDKKASKVIKSYGEKISKEKKDIEKAIKTKFTAAKGKGAPADAARSLMSSIINAKTKFAKAQVTGIVASAKAVVTSPVYGYCSESAKLYKKD
jgi:hypothetical protein